MSSAGPRGRCAERVGAGPRPGDRRGRGSPASCRFARGDLPARTAGGFFSILDLGQLVSARLAPKITAEGDKATTASEVKVLSVLSPGAYFKLGIARTPLVVGVGAAYAPALRGYYKTTSTGAAQDTGALATIRIGVFIAVDVTIFPFVHKPRGARR